MKARKSLGLATPFVPPQSEIQATVCGIYSEHLRVAPVGIDDEFFDLGGDSFTAVQISLAIEAATGLQIDSGEIERLASVRAVAALAER
jgi:acyl carrier protein